MTKVIDIVERKPIAVDRLLFNAERDPVSADALALMRGQLVAGTPINSALCVPVHSKRSRPCRPRKPAP